MRAPSMPPSPTVIGTTAAVLTARSSSMVE
jgi:hypothetical protein